MKMLSYKLQPPYRREVTKTGNVHINVKTRRVYVTIAAVQNREA